MTKAISQPRSPYTTLWSAALVANLGDGIGLVILPLLAATLTRDPVLIAGVATAQRLPWLFFTLISGVIVDRVDRRRLLQGANLARAAIYALLALLLGVDGLSIPLLWAAALLLGVAETLVDNAAFALLPAVVSRDQLEQANGHLYSRCLTRARDQCVSSLCAGRYVDWGGTWWFAGARPRSPGPLLGKRSDHVCFSLRLVALCQQPNNDSSA